VNPLSLGEEEKEDSHIGMSKMHRHLSCIFILPKENTRKEDFCMKLNDLTITTKIKDLSSYIFQVSENAPKKFRFTLTSRMQNYSLTLIELVYKANEVKIIDKETYRRRWNYQSEALTTLKLLAYLALFAKEQQCILPKHYANISKYTYDCLNLIVGWMRSDEAKHKQIMKKNSQQSLDLPS
jgi:hypothetical protein